MNFGILIVYNGKAVHLQAFDQRIVRQRQIVIPKIPIIAR